MDVLVCHWILFLSLSNNGFTGSLRIREMAPPGLSPGVAAGDARAASERTMTVRSRVPPSDVVVSRSLCLAQVHLRHTTPRP